MKCARSVAAAVAFVAISFLTLSQFGFCPKFTDFFCRCSTVHEVKIDNVSSSLALKDEKGACIEHRSAVSAANIGSDSSLSLLEDDSGQKERLLHFQKELYDNPYDFVLGNNNGSIRLVIFLDHACQFCKDSIGKSMMLTRYHPELKIVLKPIPVLGRWSLAAARTAVAVHMIAPDLTNDFYDALFALEGGSEDSIIKTAVSLGVDLERLTRTMKMFEVDKAVGDNLKLAKSLAISGTPTYIIEDTIIPGTLSYTEITEVIDQISGVKKAISFHEQN